MKTTITVKQEVEIKTLKVKAGVRYWEDSTVNGVEDETGELIPCREGDYWCPVIDIDTGIILNWKQGTVAHIHYKCCDNGVYSVLDISGNIVAEKDGYVPNTMCPEEEGYGDYIIMAIDATGKIEDWNFDISDFEDLED